MQLSKVERVSGDGVTVLYDAAKQKAKSETAKREPLRVVDIHSFLAMDIPPREILIEPWLPGQSLAMVYAKRGTGKTHLGLSIAYAVAAGGELLGWKVPKPRKVLYLDGEMLAASMQERLAAIARGADCEPAPGTLHIITPDLQTGFMPDLATIAGQDAVEEVTPPETALIIVDSLSSLVRGDGRENEAESWLPVATWAISQRCRGRSVLFLHHSNKKGEQRGTSKREDILDAVLALRVPADYEPNKAARFEVHIEKSRALCGDFQPVEAELVTAKDGGVAWVHKELKESMAERVRRMAADGMPKRDIAEELHVNRSTVYRILRRGGGPDRPVGDGEND
jgi:hypothetical protein